MWVTLALLNGVSVHICSNNDSFVTPLHSFYPFSSKCQFILLNFVVLNNHLNEFCSVVSLLLNYDAINVNMMLKQ